MEGAWEWLCVCVCPCLATVESHLFGFDIHTVVMCVATVLTVDHSHATHCLID